MPGWMRSMSACAAPPRHSPPAASAVVVWRAGAGSAPARRWRLHAGVIVRVALESHSRCCGSATLKFIVNDNCIHPHSVVCANCRLAIDT